MQFAENGLPFLVQESDDPGWIDLTLKIVASRVNGQRIDLDLSAVCNGVMVGLSASVDCSISKGIVNGQLDTSKFVKAGVILASTGAPSDALLAAIATLQGNPATPTMVARETFTAFALMSEDFDPLTGAYKLKIFGRDTESDTPDDYYESLFNVDLVSGYVFWNERDPDYRKPLLRSLGREPGG